MQSKTMKNFMAKLYGIGAAVVILGAMFKIMHWPGAGPMLVTGLSTEAVIFFFSAFEKPHEETDWSLVYPELAHAHVEDDAFGDEEEHEADEVTDHEGTVTQQLDEMLEEAKVGPELISSLGDGLKSISDNVSSLNDLTDSTVATNEYNENVKKASSSLSSMNEAYIKGGEVMTDLAGVSGEIKSGLSEVSSATSEYSDSMKSATASLESMNSSYSRAADAAEQMANVSSADAAQGYNEQLQKVTQNLSSLNSMYEIELKDTETHLQTMNEFYGGLSGVMQSLNASVEDTKKYKEEIAVLNQNLATLNAVYGSMLSAMRVPLAGGNSAKVEQPTTESA
ncbi:MAG: gliding motility protein GldL [Bacteroidetes bacterium]|nr:MAG: gliding motility protein GldL [Bacteroidota bacterium]